MNWRARCGIFLTFTGLSLLSRQAYADVWVEVPNAAHLSFQTMGADVYLRNLNQFDSRALGCCYNYWIDTSTVEGKNIFAVLLEDIALGLPVAIGVPDGYARGVVADSGNNF